MQPPHALRDLDQLETVLGHCPLQIFLDYDGTLTPIVSRPEHAVLDPHTRQAIQTLARRYPVAVISGRELADVKARVNLPQLYYAGNHGFEIAGPAGSGINWQIGGEYAQALDALHQNLRERLPRQDGLILEHKHYSLSIHYRLLSEDALPELRRILSSTLEAWPQLQLRSGKKVFEIRPDIDWHKGKAMLRLIEVFSALDDSTALPVFIGDDLTDEDAFRELRDRGIGILVGQDDRETAAHFRLNDSTQVRQLLDYLSHRCL